MRRYVVTALKDEGEMVNVGLWVADCAEEADAIVERAQRAWPELHFIISQADDPGMIPTAERAS